MSDAAEVINTVLNEDGRYIPKSIERDERTSRGLIPKLMRVVGKIPFADDLVAAWYAARDPHTPMRAKAVLFAAVAYFVTPLDMLPDFITGLGFTDDATVLANPPMPDASSILCESWPVVWSTCRWVKSTYLAGRHRGVRSRNQREIP